MNMFLRVRNGIKEMQRKGNTVVNQPVLKYAAVFTGAVIFAFSLAKACAPQAFEAENLTVTASSAGSTKTYNQPGASNEAFVQFTNAPTTTGDWLSFTFTNNDAGAYTITAYCKKFYNRGICQGALDGVNQGGTIDLYSESAVQQAAFSMGNAYLSVGNHTLRFTVTGKNAANTSGEYMLVFDKFALTPCGPVIQNPAQASPPTVTGTTTSLSVLGTDDGGEANLTYTWATTGTPPAPVSFSVNGTNASKNTVASFTKIGTYALKVTVKDANNYTATSTVTVTVTGTLTAITVTPDPASVAIGSSVMFTASPVDQFGNPFSGGVVSWSINAPTPMSPTNGLTSVFTPNIYASGSYTVKAQHSAGPFDEATVTIVTVPTYQLTVSAATGGNTAPSGAMTVAKDALTTITATPATGYVFVNWTRDATTTIVGDSTQATTTVKLSTANGTVTANFQALTFTLTIDNDGNGTTSPTGASAVAGGTPVPITATSNAGYEFSRWEVTWGTATIANETIATTTVTLGGDAEIKAFFEVTGYVYPEVCGAGESMIVDGSAKILGDLTVRRLFALELVLTPRWQIATVPPDYVFQPDYRLKPLDEVEKYIRTQGHLEHVPSASQMMKDGVNVVEMNMALLKKVEELTLYTIELNKKIVGLEEALTVSKQTTGQGGVNNASKEGK